MRVLGHGRILKVGQVVPEKCRAIRQIASANDRCVSGIRAGFVSFSNLYENRLGRNSPKWALAQVWRVSCRVASLRYPLGAREHFLDFERPGDIIDYRRLIAQR